MLRPSGYLIFQPEKKEPLAGEALVRVLTVPAAHCTASGRYSDGTGIAMPW